MAYRVLVIDDDKLARKGLISIVPWEECGLTVVGDVSNGMAALEFLKTNAVDLAVVDLSMPVLSGLDFIQESRKLYPDLQYVVLSFHEGFEYVQSALRLGAIDYISKLRLEQEDCRQVFLRVGDLMRRRDEEQHGDREGISEDELAAFRKEWEDMFWVYDRGTFADLKRRFSQSGLSVRQAERLMMWTAGALQNAFGRSAPLPTQFNSVESCLAWAEDRREELYRTADSSDGIPACILRAVIYTERHLRKPLKAETVAEAVGMSRGYFSTTFKRVTGFTFNDYQRRMRVELAQTLLAQGATPPTDVAAAVGYEDSKYFGRLFQEQTGMTCSAYAKQMSQKSGNGENSSESKR